MSEKTTLRAIRKSDSGENGISSSSLEEVLYCRAWLSRPMGGVFETPSAV